MRGREKCHQKAALQPLEVVAQGQLLLPEGGHTGLHLATDQGKGGVKLLGGRACTLYMAIICWYSHKGLRKSYDQTVVKM